MREIMQKFIILMYMSLFFAALAGVVSAGPTPAQPAFDGKSASTTAFLGKGSEAYILNLPEVKVDMTNTSPGLQKTGVVYPLPAPITVSQLFWEQVSGGYVARIRLTSNQAKRLRYRLMFNQAAPGMEFRVQGNQNSAPLSPVDQSFIQENTIWLPITKGNAADLEIFVKGNRPPDNLFVLDAVNLIVAGVNAGNRKLIEKQSLTDLLQIKPKTLGLIREVEFDLACWNQESQYPALQEAASATALISFIKEGGSFICSGTVLGDRRNSATPWFATANHCITNQAVANTMSFEWFSQATSCGGSQTDSRYSTTSGGGRMLFSDKKNDAAFLKLRVRPPEGVAYVGWNGRGVGRGSQVWGVHHPEGDHTMVSVGSVTGLGVKINGPDDVERIMNEVRFAFGGTEIGSSGSGLFITSFGKPQWVGSLYGGPAFDYQLNYYSNLNRFFSRIQPWLGKSKRRR